MFIAILQHTPTWVFGLLFVLVALGLSQRFPRTVGRRRVALLPLVFVALSLFGVVATFGGVPLVLLAWAAGLGSALRLLQGRVDVSAVRYSAATQQLSLPGSWWPLALILALFALKFAAGVALARHPDLRHSAAFASVVSAAYGLFSGVFLARGAALWAMTRRGLPQAA